MSLWSKSSLSYILLRPPHGVFRIIFIVISCIPSCIPLVVWVWLAWFASWVYMLADVKTHIWLNIYLFGLFVSIGWLHCTFLYDWLLSTEKLKSLKCSILLEFLRLEIASFYSSQLKLKAVNACCAAWRPLTVATPDSFRDVVLPPCLDFNTQL